MNCNNCKKDGEASEMVIDHLLPRSSKDFNHEQNLRMVHRRCNKKPAWYKRIWLFIKGVFKKWQAERRRQRFLNIQLEKLTDPTFLERATSE